MKQITTLSSDAKQSLYFVTEDGEILHLTFLFSPRQQTWFLDLESDKFSVFGIQIGCSVNLLDKYRNLLNYGILVSTEDGNDPWRVDDFESGYCSFCFLNKDEVEMTIRYLNG